MTTSDLLETVRRHAGNRASATIDDAWYLDRVNHGYRTLATFQGDVARPSSKQVLRRRVRFRQLEDQQTEFVEASPTNNFIPHVSTTFSTLHVYNVTDGRPVNRTTRNELDYRNVTDTGRILLWAPGGLTNQSGIFYWARPTTATTLRIKVYKYPETLALTKLNEEPIIPKEWHEPIHLFAGVQACEMLKMYDDAKELLALAHAFIASRTLPQEDTEAVGRNRFIHIGGR